MAREKWDCVIIDPNRGFIEPDLYTPNLPGGHMNLCVPGAKADVKRLCGVVDRGKDLFDNIRVTLDSHHPIHIATPIFWVDKSGNHPAPFTLITAQDVRYGVWRTKLPSLQKRAQAYVDALEKNKRYVLCIWPPHCIIGTEGHLVDSDLRRSLMNWEADFGIIEWVTKGSNPYTEHYSGVRADVEDPQDPSTKLNVQLIRSLEESDRIVVAGWALNFCVANTVIDIIDGLSNISLAKKFVILEDCTSEVPGFENLTQLFVTKAKSVGVSFENSANLV